MSVASGGGPRLCPGGPVCEAPEVGDPLRDPRLRQSLGGHGRLVGAALGHPAPGRLPEALRAGALPQEPAGAGQIPNTADSSFQFPKEKARQTKRSSNMVLPSAILNNNNLFRF